MKQAQWRFLKSFLKAHERKVRIFAPILLGLVFYALSFINIQQSVTVEESRPAFLTRFSVSEIFDYSADEKQSPLYILILKAWTSAIGDTVINQRLLSVLFGVIAIILVFHLIKYRYSLHVACLSGILLAFSPILIRFGPQISPWSFLLTLFFASLLMFLLALESEKKIFYAFFAILFSILIYSSVFVDFKILCLVFASSLLFLGAGVGISQMFKIKKKLKIKRYLAFFGAFILLSFDFGLTFFMVKLGNYDFSSKTYPSMDFTSENLITLVEDDTPILAESLASYFDLNYYLKDVQILYSGSDSSSVANKIPDDFYETTSGFWLVSDTAREAKQFKGFRETQTAGLSQKDRSKKYRISFFEKN